MASVMAVLQWALLLAQACAARDTHSTDRRILEVDASRDGFTFHSDQLFHDSLRILHLSDQHIYVGGRDAMYNLSTTDLSVLSKIAWPVGEGAVKECVDYGHPRGQCANFIRVVLRRASGQLVLCGTHAYSPACRSYDYVSEPQFRQFEPRRDWPGHGVVPYRPDDNSTFLYDATADQLYTATVVDSSGATPVVARSSLSGGGFMRTPGNDVNVLNEPQFVLSTGDEEHTYFWFHEVSNGASSPCGKCLYSRVARVCKRDQHSPRQEWSTFMKGRLTCAIPGRFPFLFDELQAATAVGRTVYGVFKTPWDGLRATAVCAFRMADVEAAFHFAHAATPTGPCGEKGGELTKPIENFFREPLFVDTSMTTTFTQIAVQDDVRAVDGHAYTIIYLGTGDGSVAKLVNVDPGRAQGSVEPVHVLSFRVAPGQPVRSLHVLQPHGTRRWSGLAVATDSGVRLVPGAFCGQLTTCTGCVALRDPHCAWHVGQGCVSMPQGGWDRDVHVQQLVAGESRVCPRGEREPVRYAVRGLQPAQAALRARAFRTRDLAIAVCASMLCALAVGFVAGYFMRYRFSHPSLRSSASSLTYDTHPSTLRRASDAKACNQLLDVYGTPPQHTKLNEAVSLILSMHETTKPSPDKRPHLTPVLLNNGTLPKDYKVKKVYV